MARAGLSRDVVLAAACELADAEGIGAVSMRRLASELGVEAMSLYNHVASKGDLHAGLVDLVWSEVDLGLGQPDWRAGLHVLLGSAHQALLRHPWFFRLPLTDGGSARLAVIDATLAHLHRGGTAPETAFHALHVLDGHVYGYTWQELEFAPSNTVALVPEVMRQIVAPYPHLATHAQQHLEDPPAGDGFVIGLDMLLDGVQRQGSRSSHEGAL